MQIVNLTPHAIAVADADNSILFVVAPSGSVARVATTQKVVAELNGVPVRRTDFGAVEGIPEAKEETVYLVSTLVAQVAKRQDVVSPDTGPTAVREAGQVKAVKAFQSF